MTRASAGLRVLIVGRGGREHALAWALARSPSVGALWVAPGNAGIGSVTLQNGKPATVLAIDESDSARLVEAAAELQIDLAIVGPEAPLAAGLADAFTRAGVRCFGPTQAAARLESSKAFAKDFMQRHGIATARYAVFRKFDDARAHVRDAIYPVVIKASGLAAGKGVVLPASREEAEAALAAMMLDGQFGAAADEVVIEERLTGPEISVLAFCDGKTCRPMPVAQDHKRVGDGDAGPNTGGMGAFAPSPLVDAPLLAEIQRTVMRPAIDGLAAEGHPFVGVLFAGLMLTPAGPRVLEFNCRFGDPETQAILPLLETDLADILVACVEGRLDRQHIQWRQGSAVSVVAASEGYPGPYQTGRAISGIEAAADEPDTLVFCAGARFGGDGTIVTDGGRVLAVTGLGGNLAVARKRAYAGLDRIRFQGMHARSDIGGKAP